MKRKILVVLGLLAFLGVGLTGYATAATTGTVSATVTAQQVAVSVNPGTVAYGALSVGDINKLPTPASFTATNDGNVNENFAIHGANTTPDNWTLAGTANVDTYVHRFSTDGGSTFTALTTGNQTLASAVIPAAGQAVNLNLDMPTATTATAEQTAAVTVLATAS